MGAVTPSTVGRGRLELGSTFSGRVLAVRLDLLSLLAVAVLLGEHPVPEEITTTTIIRFCTSRSSNVSSIHVLGLDTLASPAAALDVGATSLVRDDVGGGARAEALRHLLLRLVASEQTEVELLGLGTVGEINDETAREAASHGAARDLLHLLGRLGVELQHGARAALEARVERREEAREALARRVLLLVRVAEPLDGRDADAAVEDSGAKRQPAAHVLQEHIATAVALGRNVQHVLTVTSREC